MESVHHVNVPLRAGKKMKKRKELDALVVSGKRVKRGSQDQLLSETTDEEQDSSSHWSAKDRRCRVFVRRRVFVSLLRACTAALVFACVVATTTVLWLFIDIREQVTSLRNELDQVVAGSQAFPDALQKCHSLSRDLQQNQTLLFNNFAMLSHQLQNLSNQLIGMQAGLQSVEERLKAAPELVNLPQDMQSLSTSVASFGSQIRDLNTTVTGLKNDNGQLQELAKTFRENVTTLKEKVVQLVNVTQQLQTPSTEHTAEKEALWPVITQLTANMTQLNDTFNNKLQWLQNDQSKDHKLIVGLQDSSQNMSARLTTLEGECVKSAVHSALNETVDKLIHQVTDSTSRLNEVSRQVKELQTEIQQLENSASQFAVQPSDIESIVGPTGVPQQTQGTEDSSNQSISPKPI